MLPRWLRRKLKKWRSGFARIPRTVTKTVFATVLVVGAFLGGGPPNEAWAGEIIVNYEESDGRSQNGSFPWDGGYVWNGSWGAISGQKTFTGTTAANNGVIHWINQADQLITVLNPQNTVVLSNNPVNTPSLDSNPSANSYSTRYRSNWGSTSNSDTTAINIGNDVTLRDDRSVSGTKATAGYTINSITKNGSGILTIQNGGVWNNGTTFAGNAGGITLNNAQLYTSTNATAGGATGFTFDTGANWWEVSGTLTTSGTFTKDGSGRLSTNNTTVTGTSNLVGGGRWQVANTLQVGNGTGAGTLNITNGTLEGGTAPTTTSTSTTDTSIVISNVGSSNGTGTGTVNVGTSGIWRTALTNIGNSGTGSVSNSGNWYSTGTTNVGNGANGSVTTSGTWDATGQAVNVGVGGTGSVTQTAGTWTNQFTNVGAGLTGTVTQMAASGNTNSSHTDQYAQIGNLSSGSYTLGGRATGTGTDTWNTISTIPGVTGVGAQIGVGNGVTGTVNVRRNGTWNITNALTVGENGNGNLNITGGGQTIVSNAANKLEGVIIGNNSSSNSQTTVSGTGSLLAVTGQLTTGKNGSGSLYVLNGGKTTVSTNHVIADATNSHGRDHVDGDNSLLAVDGNMIVGNQGTAGGTVAGSIPGFSHNPVYLDANDSNAWYVGTPYATDSAPPARVTDPTPWLGSVNLGGATNPRTWNSDNAPGLAITNGGIVTVAQNATVAVGTAANRNNAYTVIDNKGDATTTRATWDITGTLTLSDFGHSYTRVANGGLLKTGDDLTMANQSGSTAVLDVYATKGTVSSSLDVTGNFTVAELGDAAFNLFNSGLADIHTGDVIVADSAGSRGTVNIHTGGKKTVHDGDMFIANDRNTRGNVNIWGAGSTLDIRTGNLITGYDDPTGTTLNGFAQGNLYAWDGAYIHVGGNHIIADGINALGRDYIDMYGTQMIVDGTLTVGNNGQAGGTYTENRYDNRYENDPANGLWLGEYGFNGDQHSRTELASIFDAKTRDRSAALGSTGNDPGLAITRGAYVSSGRGEMGVSSNNDPGDPVVNGEPLNNVWSNGYGVIDNAGNTLGGNTITPALSDADLKTWLQSNNPGVNVNDAYVQTWKAAHPYYNTIENRDFNPIVGSLDNPYYIAGGTVDPVYGTVNPYYGSMENIKVFKDYKDIEAEHYDDPTWTPANTEAALRAMLRDKFNGSTASTWDVQRDLVIAKDGNAVLRVLNGGLLRTGLIGTNANGDSTILGSGIGNGTLHVYGNDPQWGRSVWQSLGATVVGAASHSRGTIRINDGALGETAGLYIGTTTGSQGEVSVMGQGSTLHITKNSFVDPSGSGYQYAYDPLNPPAALNGTGLFSASDQALVWMDQESEVRLNGIAQISTGSILHLNGVKDDPLTPGTPYERDPVKKALDPIFDAGEKRVNFTNSRLEGIGTVTGANGVFFLQDSTWTPAGGPYAQTEIDPGLWYGWDTKCEKDYYGTLTFGHTLRISGDVHTLFDVNAGYDSSVNPMPWTNGSRDPEQDHIIVQGDPNNPGGQVVATLGGTLKLHARLTDYFTDDLKYDVVTTIGANGTKGLIDRPFDDLYIMPKRFFTGAEQWIEENSLGDDVLYVKMTLHQSPFESSAQTYNEASVGRSLDQLYSIARSTKDQGWLQFLRQFWYEDNDEVFRKKLQLYSGEIRAHSMLMPIQNPWTYAHERNGFSRCTDHVFFGPQNRNCNIVSGRNLWGTFIHTENSTGSDGNAGEYDLRRNGFVVGYERASQGGHSYLGAMFAFNQSKLNAWRSNANSDDFQIGLYHGKKAWDTWEWKNFLGMGIQNYNMSREIDLSLSSMNNTGGSTATALVCEERFASGDMLSSFAGLTMAGSTELARPFYFGKCCQWTLKPYMGLDLMATWQNSASEDGLLIDSETGQEAYYDVGTERYRYAGLVALNYHSATNVRLYGRPGIMLERGGSNGNLRLGVSYSYLMGGHRYTNVNNQFQYGGDKFNIRGVDDGSGFVTANAGAAAYIGKRKLSMVYIDYAVMAGSHSTTHAAQLGIQRNF